MAQGKSSLKMTILLTNNVLVLVHKSSYCHKSNNHDQLTLISLNNTLNIYNFAVFLSHVTVVL